MLRPRLGWWRAFKRARVVRFGLERGSKIPRPTPLRAHSAAAADSASATRTVRSIVRRVGRSVVAPRGGTAVSREEVRPPASGFRCRFTGRVRLCQCYHNARLPASPPAYACYFHSYPHASLYAFHRSATRRRSAGSSSPREFTLCPRTVGRRVCASTRARMRSSKPLTPNDE